MRYQPDHKLEARTRLIEAAGRGFRRRGYGGIGVDGLAKEAGVTSGAFYGHFKSKDAAFEVALLAGLEELRTAVLGMQEQHGAAWAEALVDFYLGEKRTCELGASCALQSLTPDVQRADPALKAVFESKVKSLAAAIARGLTGDDAQRSAKAWALIAILTGAVTLARSVDDSSTADQIAASARSSALALVKGC
jgi:TetR/AcrR family transcriptional regulator, transcriptional repressor for nem operon